MIPHRVDLVSTMAHHRNNNAMMGHRVNSEMGMSIADS